MTTEARPRLRRSLLLSTASSGSAVLLLVLIARASAYLSQADFGVLSYGLVLAAITETLIDLGMHQLTIRSVARDRDAAARLLHNTLALKAIPAVLVTLGVSAYVLTTEPAGVPRLFYLLMIASSLPRTWFMTVRGVILGLERFGRDTALVVADRALLLGAGVMVLASGGDVMALALVFIGVRTALLIVSLVVARQLVGSLGLGFDFLLWRELQQAALPVGAFLVAFGFYAYVDMLMLQQLRSAAEVGLYGAAYRIYEGLCYAPAVVASVLAPRLAALWNEDRQAHRRLAVLGLGAAVAMAVVVSIAVYLIASPLVQAIFSGRDGVDYGPSVPALQILTAGLPFIFAIWILHTTAISVFREHLLLRTTVIGVVANAALNLYLIPAWGITGAATATVLGEALTVGLLLVGLRDVLSGSRTASVPRPPAGAPQSS